MTNITDITDIIDKISGNSMKSAREVVDFIISHIDVIFLKGYSIKSKGKVKDIFEADEELGIAIDKIFIVKEIYSRKGFKFLEKEFYNKDKEIKKVISIFNYNEARLFIFVVDEGEKLENTPYADINISKNGVYMTICENDEDVEEIINNELSDVLDQLELGQLD